MDACRRSSSTHKNHLKLAGKRAYLYIFRFGVPHWTRVIANLINRPSFPREMTQLFAEPIVAQSHHGIIAAGLVIAARAAALRKQVRDLLYEIVLLHRECPVCQRPSLRMLRESWCQCRCCQAEFDPTVQYQACPDCESGLVRRVSHYWCPRCRKTVPSHYCVDERVFDPEYFRTMMQESRQRRQAQLESVRQMLAESRSRPITLDCQPDAPADWEADLDAAIGAAITPAIWETDNRDRFDYRQYHDHILDLVKGCVVRFDGVASLIANSRLDRVFRFITIIIMDHEGELRVLQNREGTILLEGT